MFIKFSCLLNVCSDGLLFIPDIGHLCFPSLFFLISFIKGLSLVLRTNFWLCLFPLLYVSYLFHLFLFIIFPFFLFSLDLICLKWELGLLLFNSSPLSPSLTSLPFTQYTLCIWTCKFPLWHHCLICHLHYHSVHNIF